MSVEMMDFPRTYAVRTLGCQMNEHDSERISGLLEKAGLVPVDRVPAAAARATDAGDMGADVIVINTCSVRENAATRLFGNLGQLAAVKRERPGMQIAVGGCLAQQMRDGIIEKAPWVDAVFGTHNIDVLPALLRRAEHNREAAVEIEESLKVFPSTLPTHRESAYAAWVSISVGCNNTCTFCIVPHLRGKERDRRPGTPAADREDQVPQDVALERYKRLLALQERICAEDNAALVGNEVEVLVAAGEGRKDGATHRISGRARDNRLVHVALPLGMSEADRPRPGDMLRARVTHGAPHHLIADSALEDGGLFELRRTRAGDAWHKRQAHEEDSKISLGMPRIRIGAPNGNA